MRRRTLAAAAIGVVIVAAIATALTRSSGTTTRPVSGELIGAMFDGPVLRANVNLPEQLDTAAASGVESLRISVDWSQLQPYQNLSDVPIADRSQFQAISGVPTRLAALDRLVAAAAAKRLSVLPVIQYTPSWDAERPENPASPPKSMGAYAAFLTGLVKRYGPTGTFWTTHPDTPKVPIRMWQIGNEPHFVSYWSEQPFAPSYVRLLATARTALKAADPGAKVVLAGLADTSWEYLDSIYRVPGAGRLFDVVAIHPYTAHPSGVITILQRARAVMDRFGDARKPILVTEITWPSSQGKAPPQFGVSTTEDQQARRLGQVMPLLEQNRTKLGLMGFYWYTWLGDESPGGSTDAFRFAGLLRYVNGLVTAKPALSAFTRGALAIEGCRRKVNADGCAH
jgi:Glycosyl hydrolase family 53